MANKQVLLTIIIVGLLIGGVSVGYLLLTSGFRDTPSSENNFLLSPPAAPQVLEKPDSIKDWQTYRSKDYGFKISYPPSYIIEDQKEPDEHFTAFGPQEKGTGLVLVIIVVTDPNKSYDEALAEFRKTTGSGLQEKPRIVAGINGIEFRGEADGRSQVYTIIPYKGKPLGFFATRPNQTSLDGEDVSLLELFVSSFVP